MSHTVIHQCIELRKCNFSYSFYFSHWLLCLPELLIDPSFLQNIAEACPFLPMALKALSTSLGSWAVGGVVGSGREPSCSRVCGSPAGLPGSTHCWSPHPTTEHCRCQGEMSPIHQIAICDNILLLIHLARYSSIHFILLWTLVYYSHSSAQVFPHKNMDTCTILCMHSKSNVSGKQQMLPLQSADTQ